MSPAILDVDGKGRFESLVDRLLASYASDGERWLRGPDGFITRTSGFAEYDLLNAILFYPYSGARGPLRDGLYHSLVTLSDIVGHGMAGHQVQGDAEQERVLDETLAQLPMVRETLKTDAQAAYQGDPSARTITEIVRSYPGFKATLVHRFAHELYLREAHGYARELSELAHSSTGIDIHPGARIGPGFFIDHGGATVIGETAIIGSNVRIYQDVTLGVLHFEQDKDGALKKGYPRHPIIGDDVVIGAGAKVLGRVRIGDGSSIGANAWIHADVPERTTVYIDEHPRLAQKRAHGQHRPLREAAQGSGRKQERG